MSNTVINILDPLPTLSKPTYGVGEYVLPDGQTHASWMSAKKAHLIALFIVLGLAAAAVTTLFFIAIPLAALVITAQVVAYVAIVAIGVRSVIKWMALNNLAPPAQDLPFKSEAIGAPKPGEWQLNPPVKTYPLVNALISNEYKLALLRSAKESIVWSGCYFGGEIFSEALQIIKDKLAKKELKEVIIMASSWFMTAENQKELDILSKNYPQVVRTVVHPDSNFMTNMRERTYLSSTNHTKVLIIDGSTAIVGGTGLVDNWRDVPEEKRLSFALLPQSFNDTDYLFQATEKGSVVSSLYLEMRKLYTILAYRFKDPKIFEEEKAKPFSMPFHPSSMEVIHQASKITGSLATINPEAMKLLVSCPEQTERSIVSEMLQMIENAKDSIFLAQMYFHPPKKILKALQDALNRGVQVTILTNGWGSDAPGTHYFYGALNHYYLSKLCQGTNLNNLCVRENRSPGETFHHKFFAADDEAIIGSANMGWKSLNGADYEVGLAIKSNEFVDQSRMEILQQSDKCAFIDLNQLKDLSFGTKLLGQLQYYLKFIL